MAFSPSGEFCVTFYETLCKFVVDPFMATLSNDRELRIFSTTTFKCVRRISKCTLPGVDKENDDHEFRLLHDDQLASFTRRLQYSKCGQLLFVPGGLID